jgi:hypothetical protein
MVGFYLDARAAASRLTVTTFARHLAPVTFIQLLSAQSKA